MQIKDLFWCKNCLNMNTRPRITFDQHGWCNACQWMVKKKNLNWKKRKKELLKLLDKYRSKNNEPDCIVYSKSACNGS